MLSDTRLAQIRESNWFAATASPYLIVDTDLTIRAVNRPYEKATGHAWGAMVGEPMFEVFPDNPDDPGADSVACLTGSLESVFRHGARHWMGVQHYDVPNPRAPATFVHKVWVPVNTPIKDQGRTVGALHHVEDVTEVLTPTDGHPAVAICDLRAAAQRLALQFPRVSFEATLGAVAHSHAIVKRALGRPDGGRAEDLARLRLEVLARHPAAERGGRPA